jgi:hypothetical protein
MIHGPVGIQSPPLSSVQMLADEEALRRPLVEMTLFTTKKAMVDWIVVRG